MEMEHPTAGPLRLLGTPARLHDTPPAYRLAPPELGQHNRPILGELGYPPERIVALEQEGVISS